MDSKKALLGIVAGFAAGVVVGVIFAPDKGARIRRGIVRKGEDLADALSDRVDEKFDELINSLAGGGRKAKSKTNADSTE